jgi:hypothetical protein
MLKPGNLYFPEDDVYHKRECERGVSLRLNCATINPYYTPPNANLFVLIPSDNGNCLVRYPFEYGEVVYVQN